MAAMIQSFWAILGLLVSPANACTIIAVGRSASASGAPMIGRIQFNTGQHMQGLGVATPGTLHVAACPQAIQMMPAAPPTTSA